MLKSVTKVNGTKSAKMQILDPKCKHTYKKDINCTELKFGFLIGFIEKESISYSSLNYYRVMLCSHVLEHKWFRHLRN